MPLPTPHGTVGQWRNTLLLEPGQGIPGRVATVGTPERLDKFQALGAARGPPGWRCPSRPGATTFADPWTGG